MKNLSNPIVLILGTLILFVIGLIGWVLNIITLAHMTEFSGMAAARVLGVLIPFIGAVLGYF